MIELGGDAGNYTVIPSSRQVADLRALGLGFFIVGTSYGYVSGRQLAAFEAGGMEVSEYQFPAKLRPTQRPWWVDAELPDATQASLRNALRSGSCGVYTRRGFWQAELGGWSVKAEFPNAQLWDARYVHGDGPCLIFSAMATGGDVQAAIARELSWLSPFVPYGGFASAAVTQWHNSITIAGVNMDLNIREPSGNSGELEGGRMYSDQDIDAKVGAVLAAVIETNKKAEAQTTLLEALIPPLVTGTAAEARARYIWAVAGKPWPV